jgi:hypothetical protein
LSASQATRYVPPAKLYRAWSTAARRLVAKLHAREPATWAAADRVLLQGLVALGVHASGFPPRNDMAGTRVVTSATELPADLRASPTPTWWVRTGGCRRIHVHFKIEKAFKQPIEVGVPPLLEAVAEEWLRFNTSGYLLVQRDGHTPLTKDGVRELLRTTSVAVVGAPTTSDGARVAWGVFLRTHPALLTNARRARVTVMCSLQTSISTAKDYGKEGGEQDTAADLGFLLRHLYVPRLGAPGVNPAAYRVAPEYLTGWQPVGEAIQQAELAGPQA